MGEMVGDDRRSVEHLLGQPSRKISTSAPFTLYRSNESFWLHGVGVADKARRSAIYAAEFDLNWNGLS